MRNLKKIVGILLAVVLSIALFACSAPAGKAKSAQSGEVATEGGSTAGDAATVAESASEDMEAYLFVHFVGEDAYHKEQIYFTVSRDAKDWETLNGGEPVLGSPLGERGVRDPHIIRSPDGKKFYIIATDLSMFNINGDWGKCQNQGSDSLIVWESTDLVNWSEPRKVKVARENHGCTWAPESIYDKEKGAYMVFWASPTPKLGWHHRIYRCYTTDFVTFTEPEVYIERDENVIDTTIIEADGMYYRFTKDETSGRKYIFMEKCDSLSGDFEEVATYTLNGNSYKTVQGVEGATIFKVNGVNQWYLYFDDFGGKGYYPFVTDDLSVGEFTEQSSGISFHDSEGHKTHMRHGSVLPITLAEYNKLKSEHVGVGKKEAVFSLDFDDDNLSTSTGSAEANGTLSYVDGVNGGRAVQFSKSANNYITVKTDKYGVNPLKGKYTATVSFAVKTLAASGNSWSFYAAPNADEPHWGSEKYIGALDKPGGIECERFNNSGGRSPSVNGTYSRDEWVHVTLVYNYTKTLLYINGEKVDEEDSSVDLIRMLGDNPVIYLGKAPWTGGEYSDNALDAVKIHNYALGASDVQALYKSDMGIA